VVSASQQVIDGKGSFELSGIVLSPGGKASRDVVPGQFPERCRDLVQVLPGTGDPAVRTAGEHPGDVIRIVVDLPLALPAGDPGFLLPDRVEFLDVVGPVADLRR
jgi:hypothetical protein